MLYVSWFISLFKQEIWHFLHPLDAYGDMYLDWLYSCSSFICVVSSPSNCVILYHLVRFSLLHFKQTINSTMSTCTSTRRQHKICDNLINHNTDLYKSTYLYINDDLVSFELWLYSRLSRHHKYQFSKVLIICILVSKGYIDCQCNILGKYLCLNSYCILICKYPS